MKKLTLLVLVWVVISGCATKPRSSGIMPFGPETYKIIVLSHKGGIIEAETIAIGDAHTHCFSQNKNFMPIQAEKDRITYHLIFSCLHDNDPALKKPGSGIETTITTEAKSNSVIYVHPLPPP